MVKYSWLVSAIICIACNRQPAAGPKQQPDNRKPPNTFFVPGKNAGYWCHAEVHSHRNSAFITLYDTASGLMVFQKRMVVVCALKGNPLWLTRPEKQIIFFNGSHLKLQYEKGQDSCWMQ